METWSGNLRQDQPRCVERTGSESSTWNEKVPQRYISSIPTRVTWRRVAVFPTFMTRNLLGFACIFPEPDNGRRTSGSSIQSFLGRTFGSSTSRIGWFLTSGRAAANTPRLKKNGPGTKGKTAASLSEHGTKWSFLRVRDTGKSVVSTWTVLQHVTYDRMGLAR